MDGDDMTPNKSRSAHLGDCSFQNHDSNRSLVQTYGTACCDMLIEEIGKHPVIYKMKRKALDLALSQQSSEVKKAWRQVMLGIGRRPIYNDVPPDLAFRAWRTIRIQYRSQKCAKRYSGKIAYLENSKLTPKKAAASKAAASPILPELQPSPPIESPPNADRNSDDLASVSTISSASDLSSDGIDEPITTPIVQPKFDIPKTAIYPSRLNAVDTFRKDYGQETLEVLIELVSREADFYENTLTHIDCPTKLSDAARSAWFRIMGRFGARNISVRHNDAFKAWRCVRRNYQNSYCPATWRKKLPFLNALSSKKRARPRSERVVAVEEEASASEDESLPEEVEVPNTSDAQINHSKAPVAADSTNSPHTPNRCNNLLGQYGEGACQLMISEVGKHPDFYVVNAPVLTSAAKLPARAQPSWKKIMAVMEAHHPGVPEKMVFSAWRMIRKTYNGKQCPKKYANKIAYLNEIAKTRRKRKATVDEANTSEDESEEPNMPEAESDPSEASDVEELNAAEPTNSTHTPNKNNSLLGQFGEGACQLMISEIGKHPNFWAVNPRVYKTSSDLPALARSLWKKIMTVMEVHHPGVRDQMVFKAWRLIRKVYNSKKCPQKYVNKIWYLDELSSAKRTKRGKRSAMVPEANESADESEEPNMPETENDRSDEDEEEAEAAVPANSPHTPNRCNNLLGQYGEGACQLMISEIGKQPDFWTVNPKSLKTSSNLPERAKSPWKKIMAVMEAHHPGVPENMVFKAWKATRKVYNTINCPKKYANKIWFLNKLFSEKRGKRGATLEESNFSVDATEEESMPHAENSPPEALDAGAPVAAEPQSTSSTYTPNRCNSLVGQYGDGACQLMISEIGKHPDFWVVSAKAFKTAAKLPARVKLAWKKIMAVMEAHHPGVPDHMVFRAWRMIRKTYNTKQCPKKYANKIAYLNKYFMRAHNLFSLYGTAAADAMISEAGKYPEFYCLSFAERTEIEDLPAVARNAWTSIAQAMATRFPMANEALVFGAWRVLRRIYHTPTYKGRYAGKIAYLNEFYRTQEASAPSQMDAEAAAKEPSVLTANEVIELPPPSPAEEPRPRKRSHASVEPPSTSTSSIEAAAEDHDESPRPKTKKSNATVRFEEEYGSEVIHFLFAEIGKEAVFYGFGMGRASEISGLKHDVRRAWNRIFRAVQDKYPAVDQTKAYKAWSSLRKNYYNASGVVNPYNGKLDFLNNWDHWNNRPKSALFQERSPSPDPSEVDIMTVDNRIYAALEPPEVFLPEINVVELSDGADDNAAEGLAKVSEPLTGSLFSSSSPDSAERGGTSPPPGEPQNDDEIEEHLQHFYLDLAEQEGSQNNLALFRQKMMNSLNGIWKNWQADARKRGVAAAPGLMVTDNQLLNDLRHNAK